MSKIVQFSTIGALMAGHFHGECDVRGLHHAHAFGLGCSEMINGELTIFQGDIWEATADEPVHQLDDYLIPFVQLTSFNPRETFEVSHIDQNNAAQLLGNKLPIENIFVAVAIKAQFDKLVIRRPHRAKTAVRDVNQVAAEQQEDMLFKIEGHLVGFWTPELYGRISVPGFHFHFVDTKRQVSGHVLSFEAKTAQMSYEEKSTIEITNPHSEPYKNLAIDVSALDELIAKIEK